MPLDLEGINLREGFEMQSAIGVLDIPADPHGRPIQFLTAMTASSIVSQSESRHLYVALREA